MKRFLPLLVPLLTLVPQALVLLCTHWKRRPQPLVTFTHILLLLQAVVLAFICLWRFWTKKDAADAILASVFASLCLLLVVFDLWIVSRGRRNATQAVTAFSIVAMTATMTLMTILLLNEWWNADAASLWFAILAYVNLASVIVAMLLVTWVRTPVWMQWLAYTTIATHMILVYLFAVSVMVKTCEKEPTCPHLVKGCATVVFLFAILCCDLLVICRPRFLSRLSHTHLAIRIVVSILFVVLPIAALAVSMWWD